MVLQKARVARTHTEGMAQARGSSGDSKKRGRPACAALHIERARSALPNVEQATDILC